jgi:hypothetical protein
MWRRRGRCRSSGRHRAHRLDQVSDLERLGQDGSSGRDLDDRIAGHDDTAPGGGRILGGKLGDQVGSEFSAQMRIYEEHVVGGWVPAAGLVERGRHVNRAIAAT